MSRLATTQLTRPEGLIDLGIGQPDAALLPEGGFDASRIDRLSLAYGAPAGDGRFREALAPWLSEQLGTAIAAESLLISNGSSNAIDMICTRFSRPGDTVLVEEPTYFIALKQFADHGLTVVPVNMDAEGLNPQALTEAIARHKPAFVYTIPAFHNPTGIHQPPKRRRALVRLAKEHGCLMVADEVYPLLDYGQAPQPPLASLDTDAPVLSIGSFSKILAPGLRLGWLQGPAERIESLSTSGLLSSGGGLAPVTSALMRPMLENGQLTEHLTNLRRTLKSRRDALASALTEHAGNRLTFDLPTGGYFLWAQAEPGVDTQALLPEAKAQGVAYLPGAACFTHTGTRHAMRLCFAFYDEVALRLAAERLGEVI
ncbi:MAG: aminotransferase-like domain-containing protein [Saccharospirillum sp.]